MAAVFHFMTMLTILGIATKARAFFVRQKRQARMPSPAWWTNLIPMVFIGGGLLLTFGVSSLTTHYYDYLSAYLFMGWVMVVWCGAGTIVYLVEVFAPTMLDAPFLMRFSFGVLLLIAFGFIVGVVQVELPLTAQALWQGPQFAEGVVERKSSGSGRSGTHYYATINEVHYHVPDGAWWRTMERGQLVEFAYADDITFDTEAFAINKIRLTPLGAVMIAAGLVLWLITTVVAVKGWVEIREYFEGLGTEKVWPRPYPVTQVPEDVYVKANEEVVASFSLGSCLVAFGLFAFVAVVLGKVLKAKR